MTIEKVLIVSDEFINIYKNFNVIDQIENMKKLSRKELFLLLIFSLDKHSDEDPVVIHNLQPFKEECMLIFDLQDDKEVDNEYIKELVELTDDKYIDTDVIVDTDGNKLPEPLTKEEVRDAKINIINK
jgi:type IV secretory pathway VirB4 component